MTPEERWAALANALHSKGESESLMWGKLDLDERTYLALAGAIAPLVEEWITEESKIVALVNQEGGYAEGYEAGVTRVEVQQAWTGAHDLLCDFGPECDVHDNPYEHEV